MNFAFLNSLIAALVYHAAQATEDLGMYGTGGTSAIGEAMRATIDNNGQALKQSATAAVAEVPLATGMFVEGFIQAYFEKVTLGPGEKQCIETNSEHAVQGTVGLIETFTQLIGQLVAHETPNALLGMSGIAQVLTVTGSVSTLVRECLHEDALVVWNQTLEHLKDPNYVQGRFLANGLDMAKVVADAIPAYTNGNMKQVGSDFGTLMRKILLSQNTGTTGMVLPEGVDQNEVGTDVATGIIQGLFPVGSKVTVTNKADTSKTFTVDLHECVAKEAPYFSAAFNALYLAITQVTTNIEQWQLRTKGVTAHAVGTVTAGQHAANGLAVSSNRFTGALPMADMDWMNKLNGVMINLPTLMDRCGFDESERQLMSEALKDINSVSMSFTVPGPPDRATAADEAAVKFENATQAWEAGHYSNFGFYLGDLMRDLLLTIYPQTRLYADHGHLRLGARIGDFVHNPVGALTVFVGGFAAIILLALVVVRVAGRQKDSAQAAGRAWLETQADLECEAESVE
jgi:hypothetical protein